MSGTWMGIDMSPLKLGLSMMVTNKLSDEVSTMLDSWLDNLKKGMMKRATKDDKKRMYLAWINIHRILDECYIRRKAKVEASLHIKYTLLPMDPETAKQYKEVEAQFNQKKIGFGDAKSQAQQLTSFGTKKYTDDYRPVGSKMKYLFKRIKKYKGDKIVVFSSFTTNYSNALQEELSKRKCTVFKIDQTTSGKCVLFAISFNPSSSATETVDDFSKKEGGAVLLVGTKSGGIGFNIQCATRLFMLDAVWNPDVCFYSMAHILTCKGHCAGILSLLPIPAKEGRHF